jgi:hypothetical protein
VAVVVRDEDREVAVSEELAEQPGLDARERVPLG